MNQLPNHLKTRWKRPLSFAISILTFGMLCICFAVLVGCDSNALESLSNDDSPDAKLEEARIALDNEDYSKAISILSGMDQSDDDVRQYLSNAYSGMAGLDTFSVLETIEEINESEDEGSIDMVGQVLGDADTSSLDKADLIEKANLFSQSIDALMNLNASDKKAPRYSKRALAESDSICEDIALMSDDQQVQLGLISLCRAVLTIAQIIVDDLDLNEITLKESYFKELYTPRPGSDTHLPNFDDSVLTGTDASGHAIDRLEILSQDVLQIYCSIEALARIVDSDESNDLEKNFRIFLRKIDNDEEDYTISKRELEIFINTL